MKARTLCQPMRAFFSLEGQWGAESKKKTKHTHVTKSLLTDEAEQVFKAVLQVQALTCDSENF